MSPLQTIRLAAFELRHYRALCLVLGRMLDAADTPGLVASVRSELRRADARVAELEGVGH
ncbi:hypothetical protein [Rathayibacter sp. AY1C9]|uniref:hypothetical protein n=1 Tax=Rathayibacter sp. AY1C9 TaxID=2080541 RepID=UPI0011B05F19|nr:hypothetical protein [Rathayibacter sp. AY1C9]